MDIQWPLVLFSLIAGTGGCLFAFVGASTLAGGAKKVRTVATAVVLVLVVVGGCLSMLHLASPMNAFAALTNIFSFSGISIELMLLGLTFAVAVAYLIVVVRTSKVAAAKVLAVVGAVLGLALAYFCGHGYVIEAQPTWSSETLPFAYLGTSLVCGAFAYDLIAAQFGEPKEELGGRMPLALVVCAALSAVSVIAYGSFLGFDKAVDADAVLWTGIAACGLVGALVFALVRMLVAKAPICAVSAAGLVCALASGVAIRVLMWVCATGYLDLFSHTVPSVMLNL